MSCHLTTRKSFLVLCSSLAMILMACKGTARAEDAYYMTIYAQQSAGVHPGLAHTFATFVKADARAGQLVETKTISWLPKSREIRLLRVAAEPGVNMDLEETLRWGKALGMKTTMWGPFRIKKELYDRAAQQVARLEKGKIQYKAVDVLRRSATAMNCIHAVSDIDIDKGPMPNAVAWGEAASYEVLVHLKRWIIEPDQVHDWVADKLVSPKNTLQRATWSGEHADKEERARPAVKLVIRISL